LSSQVFDLYLLFVHGIDEHDTDAVVFHTLDLTPRIRRRQQRFNFGDFFGDQTYVEHPAVFPVEGNGSQPRYQIQSGTKGIDI
jgi:hypothetical protein